MTLTLELTAHKEAALKAKAQAQGVSAEQYVQLMVDRDLKEPPHEAPINESQRPIWEVIAENMKGVPPEDFATLPKDGLSQIDHYVYGVPKRTS